MTNPVFHLKPTFKNTDDASRVTLSNKYTTGSGQRVNKEYDCLKMKDTVDKEHVARVILDFKEAGRTDNLNIHGNGGKLFSSFRMILTEGVKDLWEGSADGHPRTADGFAAALTSFIGEIFENGDFRKQKKYLTELNEDHMPKNWKYVNVKLRLSHYVLPLPEGNP